MIKTKYNNWYFESEENGFSFKKITYKDAVIFDQLDFFYPENKKLKKVQELLGKNNLKEMPALSKIKLISRMEIPNNNKYKLDERFFLRSQDMKFDLKRKIQATKTKIIITWSIKPSDNLYNNTSIMGTIKRIDNLRHYEYLKVRWQKAKLIKINAFRKKHWTLMPNDYLETTINNLNFKFICSNQAGILNNEKKEVIFSPNPKGKPRDVLKSHRLSKGSWYTTGIMINVENKDL